MIRRVSILIILLLVAAACGSSGEPTSLRGQPQPVGDELGAALGMDGDDTLPVVERNFLEACVLNDSLQIVGSGNQAASCRCAFTNISTFYATTAENGGEEDVEKAAFELFKSLDRDLRQADSLVPANIAAIVDDCA